VALQKYENGNNRVSMGRPSAIAEALQVPVSYFFQVIDGADDSGVKSEILDLLKAARGIGAPETLFEH
jgi:transcriptional regulator with XRE-family HTH domain